MAFAHQGPQLSDLVLKKHSQILAGIAVGWLFSAEYPHHLWNGTRQDQRCCC